MKFCDEKIQKHLLNGGKITRKNKGVFNYRSIKLIDNILCFTDENHGKYIIDSVDLTTDDWEIVELEYDWDKIIKDKILCLFCDDKNYKKEEVISILISKDEDTDFYINSQGFQYKYCKPFNPEDFNIAKDLKEYEE